MKVRINKNVLFLEENQNYIITINIIFGIKTKIYKSILHSTVCGYLLIEICTRVDVPVNEHIPVNGHFLLK